MSNYCTICGENVFTEDYHQPEDTNGELPTGRAHHVCYLRHVSNARLDKIFELRYQINVLQEQVESLELQLQIERVVRRILEQKLRRTWWEQLVDCFQSL